MGWTTPRTWVAGEVVTGAVGNTHWRDDLNFLGSLLSTGTLTPTNGILYGTGTAPIGVLGTGTNRQILMATSGVTGGMQWMWQALGGGSGQSTLTGTNTIATVDVPNTVLGMGDRLCAWVSVLAQTGTVAGGVRLLHGANAWVDLCTGTLLGSFYVISEAQISPLVNSTSKYAMSRGATGSLGVQGSVGALTFVNQVDAATSFTGSFTVGLQLQGAAAGTYVYNWQVWRIGT